MPNVPARVLVIEDNDALRKALAEHLARAGFSIESASEGSEGLAKLKAAPVDLILLDLSMPVVSGIGFLDAAAKEGITLPKVIVLTNDEQLLSVSEVMERGITDYLVKASTPLNRIVEVVSERLKENV